MKEKKQPLVSIILPTYNRDFSIARAIESVLNQTYNNWELIVIDDNSTDKSAEILKGYKDNRIVVLTLNNNSGASLARNFGMKKAQGDFITFLDSDDEYESTKIEAQVEHFCKSRNPKLGIVSCGAIDFLNGKEYNRRMPIRREDYISSLLAKKKRIGAGTPFLMIKGEVIKNNNILFDPSIPAMEDWDFVLQICLKYDFSFVKEYLVKVHHHEKERMYTSCNAVNAVEIIYNKYKSLLKEYPQAHKKHIKKACALIAHHRSQGEAVNFLNQRVYDNKGWEKDLDILLFRKILGFFHIKSIRSFYIKFLT